MLKKITCLVVVMALLCAVPVFAAEPELKTSEAGIQFIKEQEGFSATAYEDSIGWAIGYGTHCDVSLYPNGITEEEADRLLIDAFFDYEFGALGFSENERRSVTHGAAILTSAGQSYDKDEDPLTLFTRIANDEGVQNLALCNEYQGEIWYNKEQMQRAILLSALAFALIPKAKNFDADAYISNLFEKEAVSGYRLRELLRREKDEEDTVS